MTRFAFLRGARSLRSRSVQLAVASCRTPVGASHPPVCAIYEKSPYFRTSSSLNMAVRGIDSASSSGGSPPRSRTGCRQLSPVGGLSSPGVCNIRKRSPYFPSSSLNMAVRGIDLSLALPGQPLRSRNWLSPVVTIPGVMQLYFRTSSSCMAVRGMLERSLRSLCQLAVARSNPVGASSSGNIRKKKARTFEVFFKYGKLFMKATRTPHQIVVPVFIQNKL